jgi:uncharacterized membrane protein
MRTLGLLVVVALVWGLSVVGSLRPASADLQFCNQTASDSAVIEGYRTPHDGLSVHGLIVVKKGTCGVIVPGRLTAPTYYLRIVKSGISYGGDSSLCVVDMSDFTIEAEDKAGFKCQGPMMGNEVHIPGFKDMPLHLASFMSIASSGKSTMIVTQRNDASVHLQLK